MARLIRLRQGLGVDVDHHLVALARSARIELVVEGRLREGQGISLLLGHRVGRVSASVSASHCDVPAARALARTRSRARP